MAARKPQESAKMAGAAIIAAALTAPQRPTPAGDAIAETDPEEVMAIADIYMSWVNNQIA
jgi:hypothetical protein